VLKLVLQAILGSETLIGIFAVLAFCALLTFGILVLAWAGYYEHYGIGLLDFLQLYF
jgi:hypothetical protein